MDKMNPVLPMKTLLTTAFLYALLLAPVLHGANFTVTSTNNGGSGSLRQAVVNAEGNAEADTITFASTLSGATITLTSGLQINDANGITIDGSALAEPVVIDGGAGSNRIFFHAASGVLTLKNLTLTGGDGDGSNPGLGGAIFNAGTLTLTNCYVHGNTATGNGGAIHNTGTLTLTSCTFANNSTAASGGAINNGGTLTATNCTFVHNTADGPAGGGGAVNAQSAATDTTLIHCTVVENDASTGAGGGLRRAGGTFTINNCIVAQNTASTGGTENLSGTITQANYNFTSDDPLLDDLGDHGGRVPTMPPLLDSMVTDYTIAIPGLTTDARGHARAIDGNSNGVATPDLGAVEFIPAGFLIVANTNDSGIGSLRQAILNASQLAGPDTITFDAALDGQTISLTTTHPGDSQSAIRINDAAGVTVDATSLPGGITINDGAGTTYRLFRVTTGCALTLQGLTLANGSSGSDGGAIYIDPGGNVTLSQCILSSNQAPRGGAISTDNGRVTLSQCTLSGNTSGSGGAIYNFEGRVTLSQCTLSGNQATFGGAIYTITLFSNETRLTDCTLVNNTATFEGGAVLIDRGRISLTHCTLTGNTALPNSGSGIASFGDNSTETRVQNCIIAGNTNSDVDLYSGTFTAFTSLGGNVIGTGNATGDFNQPTDVINHTAASLKLGPLGDHGGPTQTMIPQWGSPALERAVSTSLATDQRGFPRTNDGNANGLPSPDSGAVEADVMAVTTTADELDTPSSLGSGVSLREAVRDVTPGGIIVFDAALFDGSTATTNTLVLTLGPLNPQVDCTLDGSANRGGITVVHQPTIYQQPQSLVVAPGGLGFFTVVVADVNLGITPQWRLNGGDIPGGIGFAIGFGVPTTATGVFDVVLSEAASPGTLTLNSVSLTPFSAISQPATLSVGSVPVTLLRQPVSAMLPVGGSTTLSVIATGPPPPQPALKYQWFKAGKAIPGAIKSTLAITNAQLKHAGAYSCLVSSGFDRVASDTAEIGVVDARPKTVNLKPGAKFVPKVLAAGTGLSFVWKRDATTLPSTAASFSINAVTNADEGLYTCTVSGLAGTLNTGFNTRLNVLNGAPVLDTIALPTALITARYFYQIPELSPTTNRKATRFSVTGLPPGLKCDPLTGIISGRPTTTSTSGYPLTIKATNLQGSDTETVTLNVVAMPPAALGTFAGVGERSALNDNLGARFDLITTAAGTCSGSITLGGRKKQPFTKMLLQTYGNGDAVVSARIPGIKMADTTPLHAVLNINLATGLAQLTLTHPNGTQQVIPAWRKATAVPAATYTLFLIPGTVVGAPQGYGFSTLKVSASNAVTINGKLPDNSALTGSTFIGANGEILVFHLLHGNKGSFVGQYQLSGDNLTGAQTWSKPLTTGTVYKDPFGPIGVAAFGGKYTPPTAGQLIMPANSELSFSDGGLPSFFTQPVTIANPSATGLTNTATPDTPLVNNTKISKFDVKTGVMSGSFMFGTRTAPFSARIVQTGPLTAAYGYFLLPTGVPNNTTSPKLSGQVLLGAP